MQLNHLEDSIQPYFRKISSSSLEKQTNKQTSQTPKGITVSKQSLLGDGDSRIWLDWGWDSTILKNISNICWNFHLFHLRSNAVKFGFKISAEVNTFKISMDFCLHSCVGRSAGKFPLPDLKLPPVILYVPVRPLENVSKGKQSLYSYLTGWCCK